MSSPTPTRQIVPGASCDAQRAFDWTPPPPVIDQRVPESDKTRLKGHNAAVLLMLRRGPATNAELAQMLGPGSAWRTRVSDVRLWLERHTGETVEATKVEGGLWSYRIVP